MFASPFSPFALTSQLTLKNRLIKTATYEGMVHDGLPTVTLGRHHREIAEGGVAMTTVAYCAVMPSGRTFEAQMVMEERAIKPHAALVDVIHEGGAKASLQLGHAGGFSRDTSRGGRHPLGPSAGVNEYGLLLGKPFIYGMRREEMVEVRDAFVMAAKRAQRAGYDALELHLGHGYLLSQFLSPRINHRRDAYGGSTENRLRFPLEVVHAVREAVPNLALMVKLNLDDGVEGGLGVEECCVVARALEGTGVSALVLSGGLVSRSSMFLLRGGRPLERMREVEHHGAMKLALSVFGPMMVKPVPFGPLFFLDLATHVRRAVTMPLVLLGGVRGLSDLKTAMESGFELVALGRALLSDPALPQAWARGESALTTCDRCNECIAEMDVQGGVLCIREEGQQLRRVEEVRRGDASRVIGHES